MQLTGNKLAAGFIEEANTDSSGPVTLPNGSVYTGQR